MDAFHRVVLALCGAQAAKTLSRDDVDASHRVVLAGRQAYVSETASREAMEIIRLPNDKPSPGAGQQGSQSGAV